jgi:PncC family amidohydrolase
MALMLREQVLPRIAELFSLESIPRREYRVLGDGESSVQNRIRKAVDLLAEDPQLAGVMLHYRAHTPEILLAFEALTREGGGRATKGALRKLDPLLIEALGDELFSIGGGELPERLVEALASANLTLATAESCTAGGIASMVTEAPGASRVFNAGFVTYANAAKVDFLGVPAELIEREGAVSEAVARSMARGLFAKTRSDLCVAITGIAGPGGGTPEKPVGTVHVAVFNAIGLAESAPYPDQTREPKIVHRRLRLRGKRGTVRRSAAVWALKLVWDQLREAGLAELEESSPT